MIAIDTNVLVRVVVGDEPEQAAQARALVSAGAVFVPVTVVLEASWVLCSQLRFPRLDAVAALRRFLGLPGVVPERPTDVHAALDLADRGLDLADALHLISAKDCEGFASFDRQFARRAAALGATPPVVAP